VRKSSRDGSFDGQRNPEEEEKEAHEMLRRRQYQDLSKFIMRSEHLAKTMPLMELVEQMIQSNNLRVAGQWLRDFQLQDKQDLVNRYIDGLVADSQLTLAMTSSTELVSHFGLGACASKWNPGNLVQLMVQQKQYTPALKYVQEYSLQERFPPVALVKGLIAGKEYLVACRHIKLYRLHDQIDGNELVAKMVLARQWSAVRKACKEYDVAELDAEVFVREILAARDFAEAEKYLGELGLFNEKTFVKAYRTKKKEAKAAREAGEEKKDDEKLGDEKLGDEKLGDEKLGEEENVKPPPIVMDMLEAMVAANQLRRALFLVLRYGLTGTFEPESLVRAMIEAKQYHYALKMMKDLKIEERFEGDKESIEQGQNELAKDFRALLAKRKATSVDWAMMRAKEGSLM